MSLPEPARILKLLLAEACNSRRFPWKRDFFSTVRGDLVESVASADISAKPCRALMDIGKPCTFLPLAFFLLLFPVSACSEDQNTKAETTEPQLTQDATSLSLTIQLAILGDADARVSIGLMYLKGEGLRQDYGKAVDWFRLAADQGHADAQVTLGLMYRNGEGVPQDYSEAVKWFRLAAEQGHADAQNGLGAMYANGEGVPQDHGEALKWYHLAAEQGHAYAQNSLGIMYAIGEGVPQDLGEAVKWYRLAAEQGYAYAQINLGIMYRNGEGVPQNYKEAYAWFNIAAAKGHENAAQNRDIVASKLNPKTLAEAQDLSREYYEKFK